jgi:hypothetical protein
VPVEDVQVTLRRFLAFENDVFSTYHPQDIGVGEVEKDQEGNQEFAQK